LQLVLVIKYCGWMDLTKLIVRSKKTLRLVGEFSQPSAAAIGGHPPHRGVVARVRSERESVMSQSPTKRREMDVMKLYALPAIFTSM
jgi:hypothetical protein